MEIKKRNGTMVDFDEKRIIDAIDKAGTETIQGMDFELSRRIAKAIKKELIEFDEDRSVEDIQDLVEAKLMASNRKDIAKKYILYRELRNQRRTKESKYKLLDDDFISKYKHLPSPMKPLGEFVYYRTYSRWLPEEKRREYWWETCRRAVEFNCNLVDGTTKEEAQELFDNMFNLKQFLSGRTMWSGLTPTACSNPTSQFNCSFAVIDDFGIYKDICYLLMLGVGVGFSVEKEYVSQLPKVRTGVQLIHKKYNSLPKHKRKEITDFEVVGNTMELNVGDSKNGWSSAIDYFLKVFYDNDFRAIDTVIVNYDSVRPFGEPLKTFGGKASGHDALLTIIEKIYKILYKNNTGFKKLKSIEAMDIANIIAEGIVVGGVRRSAQMCLFDADDKEMMQAKTNLYIVDDKGVWCANQDVIHRMMSNNSVAYHSKPSPEELKQRFETIKISAEGNFFNLEAAKKRKANAKGTNPCGEIILDSMQFCNLTTINAMGFVENGKLNTKKLLQAQRLSARAGYRNATVELELHKWDKVQARDRLIGCSITGYQDMVNAVGMSIGEQKRLLQLLKQTAIESANDYADSLGLNRSELKTTVKPEGSLSLLPTVSSGVHFSHSPYYIRRVRINSSDPLVKVCEELGYPVFPEVGQDWETCKTKVIEFPVKSPMGKTKYDVSAIEQLETYRMFMENYVEHNASNTISVRSNEWDGVVQWVYDNWDSVIGVTFISLDDNFYQLLPYEAITEEEYDKRVSEMKPFIPSLISKYEVEETDIDTGDSECSNGICPIR
jgi:ribonucleoside-diphosphate reductase alpha chain/ribonucleoside-triphosphate reductase